MATFFIFIFYFSVVKAANSLTVVINEIAWMGTKVDGIESKNWWRYEWLELNNNTVNPISLDGWKIELYRTDLDWSQELTGNIPTNGYFLIVSSDKIFSNYDLNYANLGGKFNNQGNKVLLKNNLGEIIDSLDCSSSDGWFSGDKITMQTMEKISPLVSSNESSNWQNSQNPGGTPKAQNSIGAKTSSTSSPTPLVSPPLLSTPIQVSSTPTPVIKKEYPAGVIINEILPSPTGPDKDEEWIELFNQNDVDVGLNGWILKDVVGKITIYTFPNNTKILKHSFLLLSRHETKITLNNSEDGLVLVGPSGRIVDTTNYKNAPLGQSYNRPLSSGTSTAWYWSPVLTPNSPNKEPGLSPSAPLSPLASKIVSPSNVKNETGNPKTAATDKEIAALNRPNQNFSFSPLVIFGLGIIISFTSGIIVLAIKRKIDQKEIYPF